MKSPEINTSNYEAFLLDDIEGNLNAQQKEALNKFLSENNINSFEPNFEDLKLTPPNISYLEKESLKLENIDINNYEYFFISYWENELNESQTKKLVLEFLKHHPETEKIFYQFKKAKLSSQHHVYSEKDKLHKIAETDNKIIPIWLYWAAAASIGLFVFFSFNKYLNSEQLYVQNELSIKKVEITNVANQNTFQNINFHTSNNSISENSKVSSITFEHKITQSLKVEKEPAIDSMVDPSKKKEFEIIQSQKINAIEFDKVIAAIEPKINNEIAPVENVNPINPKITPTLQAYLWNEIKNPIKSALEKQLYFALNVTETIKSQEILTIKQEENRQKFSFQIGGISIYSNKNRKN